MVDDDDRGRSPDLAARIRAAFAYAPYPGDDDLAIGHSDEAAALERDFRGRRDWAALDIDFLNQAPEGWGTALSFFSGAALLFYLPAYLLADIEGTLVIGDPTTRLCAFVAPQMAGRRLATFHGGGTLGEHARAEFSCFAPAEVSSIVAYLWWKLERDGYDPMVEQALEHYWLEREAQSDGS